MRWAELALVACGCGHAAPMTAPIHNTAPASPASGPLDLVFATTANESDGGEHRSIVVDLPSRLAHDDVMLFERFPGKITVARAQFVEESGSGDERLFEYELRLPPGKSEEPHDVVLLVAPASGASPQEVTDTDRAALARLRDPTSFAAVLDIGPHGIDLDGDGRADLAFVDVCIEYPDGDSVCGETATYVARRDGDAWKLTEFCVDSGGGACATGKLMGP